MIERGAIALLSNAGREPIDRPSEGWLGRRWPSPAIRESGLWTVDHTLDPQGSRLFEVLARRSAQTFA